MSHLDRSAISKTDEEIEAAFDELGYGLTIDNLSFTTDTLAEWLEARQRWADPGRLVEQSETHFVVERAQAVRGQPRRDVVMIDFGDGRAIYGCDM